MVQKQESYPAGKAAPAARGSAQALLPHQAKLSGPSSRADSEAVASGSQSSGSPAPHLLASMIEQQCHNMQAPPPGFFEEVKQVCASINNVAATSPVCTHNDSLHATASAAHRPA